MGRNLTKEEKELVIADLAVMGNTDLIRKWNISHSTCVYWRQKTGIYYQPPEKNISGETIIQCLELHEKKVTRKDIANKFGITLYQLDKILYQNGKRKSDPTCQQGELTPETANPYLYETNEDSFEFIPEDRARYEQLKAWKERNYFRLHQNVKNQ